MSSARAKRYQFVCGTGRSGSKALRYLLMLQPDTIMLHNGCPLPWNGNGVGEASAALIAKLAGYPKGRVGDVAPWYLPHVPSLVGKLFAKVVCLRRPKDETVASLMRQPVDHFSLVPEFGSEPTAEDRPLLPKYPGNRLEATSAYYDAYYAAADALVLDFPSSFMVFPVSSLDTAEGQQAILDFLEYPRVRQRLGQAQPGSTRYSCRLFAE